MNNKNYPPIGLKASYCLPYVSMAELAAVLLTISIPWINNWLNHYILLSLLNQLLNRLKSVLICLTAFLTIVWIVMLIITIIYQHNSGFNNYWRSWLQTYDLRQANKIKPQVKQVKDGNTYQTQKVINPVEQAFNYAIKGWFVDQHSNKLTIWLLIPNQADAQIIFKQKLPIIENNVHSDYSDYTFSPAERVGNFYRIEGTLKHK